MKNSQNRRFIVAQKHDATRQNQSQNVNDFVAYVEVLKIDLDEFISIQQRNHLLNRLKKKIRKKLNVVTDMSTTRDAFATLTQRIKSSQLFKSDQKNKIHNDRDSLNESDFNSRKRLDSRVENAKKRTKQRDQFNNENRRSDIIRLFWRIASKMNSDSKNDRNCYNCNKKKHFIKNCLELKQKNSQVNAVKSSRQSTHENEQKTLSSRLIIEVSNNSKN